MTALERTLDVRKYHCPEPLLKTIKEFGSLPDHYSLKILVSSPAAVEDIELWAKKLKLHFESLTYGQREYCIKIERTKDG